MTSSIPDNALPVTLDALTKSSAATTTRVLSTRAVPDTVAETSCLRSLLAPFRRLLSRSPRQQLEKIVKESGGRQLPADNQMDQHLNDLLNELAVLIEPIMFIKETGGQAAHAHFYTDRIEITYDPNYTAERSHTDDVAMRTACLLHELMHVRVDQCYIKPPGEEARDWRSNNLNYSTDNNEICAQLAMIEKSLAQIKGRVVSDGTVEDAHEHINWRLEYAMATPNVHYDTILMELLVYLRLKKLHTSETYRYLSAFSQEARDRRCRTGNRGPVLDIPLPGEEF